MTAEQSERFRRAIEEIATTVGIDKREPGIDAGARQRLEQIERLAIGLWRLFDPAVQQAWRDKRRARSDVHHSELAARAASSMTHERGDRAREAIQPAVDV